MTDDSWRVGEETVEPMPSTVAAALDDVPIALDEPHEPASMTEDEEQADQDKTESDGGAIRYSATQVKAARGVLTRLSGLRRAARLYTLNHPATLDALVQFSDAIRPFLDEGVDVQLTFFEGEILLGSQLLAEESMLFDQMDREIRALGIGSIILRVGLTDAELRRAAKVLTADSHDIGVSGGIARMAAEADLPHVQFANVQIVATTLDDHKSGEPAETPREAMDSALGLLRETSLLLKNNQLVSATHVNSVVRSLVDNVLANRYAMLQLTALRNYDEYTFYHSANVAAIALALGACVSEDHRFLTSLGAGALLHDIGKLTIDHSVLNKPGPLDPEEWEQVRQHPVSGAEMVALLPGLDRSAVVTILEHHMRWDGTGYPGRAVGKSQHLCSRIVAIADAYDAMTSRRSYSAARVEDDAMLNVARGSGAAFDPDLVLLFVALMGVYPPRSVVRLSTGEVAIVLAAGKDDPLRPCVRIIAAASGEFLPPKDTALEDTPDVSVAGCIDPRLLNIDVDDYL